VKGLGFRVLNVTKYMVPYIADANEDFFGPVKLNS
jgi:hypothetical protein